MCGVLMSDLVETIHHHELVSFVVLPNGVRLVFGPVSITMTEVEMVSPAGMSKRLQPLSESDQDLKPLLGKCMTRWLMDDDSFRLVFEDWSLLRQPFGIADSLVEIRGPVPDAYVAYPQAILDRDPERKQKIKEQMRKDAAVETYLAGAGQSISTSSSGLLHRLHRYFSTSADRDLNDFLFEYGNVQSALLYARLFVPEFKLVAGRVILDDGNAPEAYAKAITESLSGEVDPDSFNWIEVFYLFAESDTGIDPHHYDDDHVLAELIAEAWRGRLLSLFPDRKFVVEVMSPDVTGSVVGVGFREIMA